MLKIKKWSLLIALMGYAACACAEDLVVNNAWARFSVAGMNASGIFLDILNQSNTDDTLLAAKTPVATRSEIHESSQHNGMMHMQALPHGLTLPAHQTTRLQPGSFHIMLMDLKQPLKPDTTIAVTLIFKKHNPLTLTVPVKTGNTIEAQTNHHDGMSMH